MTNYYARTDVPYKGGDKFFTIPFSYINKNHIKVFINNIQTDNFTFNTESQIVVKDSLNIDDVVSIRRTTPLDERMVTFTDTSILDEDTQNLDSQQMFNALQEVYDDNEKFKSDVTEQNTEVLNAVNAKTAAMNKIEQQMDALDDKRQETLNSLKDIDKKVDHIDSMKKDLERLKNQTSTYLDAAETTLTETSMELKSDMERHLPVGYITKYPPAEENSLYVPCNGQETSYSISTYNIKQMFPLINTTRSNTNWQGLYTTDKEICNRPNPDVNKLYRIVRENFDSGIFCHIGEKIEMSKGIITSESGFYDGTYIVSPYSIPTGMDIIETVQTQNKVIKPRTNIDAFIYPTLFDKENVYTYPETVTTPYNKEIIRLQTDDTNIKISDTLYLTGITDKTQLAFANNVDTEIRTWQKDGKIELPIAGGRDIQWTNIFEDTEGFICVGFDSSGAGFVTFSKDGVVQYKLIQLPNTIQINKAQVAYNKKHHNLVIYNKERGQIYNLNSLVQEQEYQIHLTPNYTFHLDVFYSLLGVFSNVDNPKNNSDFLYLVRNNTDPSDLFCVWKDVLPKTIEVPSAYTSKVYLDADANTFSYHYSAEHEELFAYTDNALYEAGIAPTVNDAATPIQFPEDVKVNVVAFLNNDDVLLYSEEAKTTDYYANQGYHQEWTKVDSFSSIPARIVKVDKEVYLSVSSLYIFPTGSTTYSEVNKQTEDSFIDIAELNDTYAVLVQPKDKALPAYIQLSNYGQTWGGYVVETKAADNSQLYVTSSDIEEFSLQFDFITPHTLTTSVPLFWSDRVFVLNTGAVQADGSAFLCVYMQAYVHSAGKKTTYPWRYSATTTIKLEPDTKYRLAFRQFYDTYTITVTRFSSVFELSSDIQTDTFTTAYNPYGEAVKHGVATVYCKEAPPFPTGLAIDLSSLKIAQKRKHTVNSTEQNKIECSRYEGVAKGDSKTYLPTIPEMYIKVKKFHETGGEVG